MASRRRNVAPKLTPDLWPVYEFRPSPTWLREWAGVRLPGWTPPLYRYNGGAWIPDDGEYDLAFACLEGPPLCLYVDMPYHANIAWRWLTTHWRGYGPPEHPSYGSGPNPWHYSLRPGEKEWGPEWGRDLHPNRKASNEGMTWVSSQRGCANGRSAEFDLRDVHMRAGLVRERESKAVVVVPDAPECMYCGLAWLEGQRAASPEPSSSTATPQERA